MELAEFLERAEGLLRRVEGLFPSPASAEADWDVPAWRWRREGPKGWLQPIRKPNALRLSDLKGIDRQADLLRQNTRQFINRLPANHALLWGSRGTGKSSLVKALLTEFQERGLRLIEVDKSHLVDLPDIVAAIEGRPEYFVVFCDDLSFEAEDPSYKALKVVLDGSISAPAENILIYATSNRRHLLPEYQSENQETRYVGGEVHPGESVEEKVALSDRFGLWLSFYPFGQEEYLGIVRYWLRHFGVAEVENESLRLAALQWATARGNRSGRTAWQFAKDFAGRQQSGVE